MTLADFIEELNIAIKQDGHDIYCNAESAEMIKEYLKLRCSDLVGRYNTNAQLYNVGYEQLTDKGMNIKNSHSLKSELKKAEWIKPTGMMPPEYHGHYECSSCGTWAGRNWLRPWKGILLTKYCPGCGKEMINYKI